MKPEVLIEMARDWANIKRRQACDILGSPEAGELLADAKKFDLVVDALKTLSAQAAPSQPAVPMSESQRADVICAVAAICTGTSSRTVAATAIEWTERYYGITTPAAPSQEPLTDGHPMQPIVKASDGVIRFKKNQIVSDLYDLAAKHGLDMNELACRKYPREDRNQFAQLIGYSVSGWGDLSYAMNVDEADAIAALREKEKP